MDNNFAGTRQPILLTPEGQQLFDVLESYINSELPPYTNSKMNEMVNNLAAAGEFVPTVRTSVVDLFFRDGITDEQKGLTTTIVDKEEWPKEEKRYETALRLFPNILSEQVNGYYPIQWLAMREAGKTYNLKSVSLIPLVIELGIELQQFDEELRGGLLSLSPSGWTPLHRIICYISNDNELLDSCFSVVRNWMRENNCLLIEDIQGYNLVGKLFVTTEFLSESRIQYLISMDPVPLSLPCKPEHGDWLPIHWSIEQKDIRVFIMILQSGMQYYPDKFGFVFGEGTHRNIINNLYKGTPFSRACKKYGQEKVINEVINCIMEYCSASMSSPSSTSTSATNNSMETSLLMSAITDALIHMDGLYILLRKDPEAALLRLQQHFREIGGDEQTDTDTSIGTCANTNTSTNTATVNNNNNNSNNSVNICNNNTATTPSRELSSMSSLLSSPLSASDIIAAAVSSTTNNNNNCDNHNDDHNNCPNENGNNVTNQPSSSLSSNLKGKKRKQHEMV